MRRVRLGEFGHLALLWGWTLALTLSLFWSYGCAADGGGALLQRGQAFDYVVALGDSHLEGEMSASRVVGLWQGQLGCEDLRYEFSAEGRFRMALWNGSAWWVESEGSYALTVEEEQTVLRLLKDEEAELYPEIEPYGVYYRFEGELLVFLEARDDVDALRFERLPLGLDIEAKVP